MSEVRVVPDSGGDSVFDSSGESRHVEGGGPSGTSTPNQSDGEGEGGRQLPYASLQLDSAGAIKQHHLLKEKLETRLHTLRHQQLVNTLRGGWWT